MSSEHSIEIAATVDTLNAIRDAARIRRLADQRIAALVSEYLSKGGTYSDVGKALGVSKQTAWDRYRPSRMPDNF